VGFYADVVADAVSLPACPDRTTAYSVLEALRFAATRVLDMHMEDLQVLVIGHVNRDEVDGLLWDPMPGGSGLLDQMCERFEEIAGIALEVVQDCPAACETSCIDCLQTFRNTYYHKHLNRKTAEELIKAWGWTLSFDHVIPARQPSKEPVGALQPVNEAERRLKHLLLAAGFEVGERGCQIKLDRAIGTTTPDVFYRAPHHDEDEGVCIYLDGLSGHLHGNPATEERDRRIRDWLRNNGYEVIEISVNQLDDADAMTRHFRKLAGYLRADGLREALRQDTDWFQHADESGTTRVRELPRRVRPRPEERYATCVPLVPLRFAAGGFSDAQQADPDDWEWVEMDTRRCLTEDMFVAQVKGKSMEPAIPDGAYCLFTHHVPGSRHGRTVVVELDGEVDTETGERYTIKRYYSEKTASDDGVWRHVQITLKPNNPDFVPILLTCEDEGSVRLVAELLEVLG
jgi:SOS-response transcriptional repressor LexA/maleate cis-trans isomerase